MRLLFILILIPVILIAQKYLTHPTIVKPEITHVGEIKSSHTPSAPLTPTPSPTSVSATSNSPSAASPTSKSTATQTPSVQATTNDFLYPGATQKETNGTTINLQTNDDAQVVTNWYKEKIKSLGWNATSVIENDTNGEVSNQLVASSGSKEVRIQITKNNNSLIVNIAISL